MTVSPICCQIIRQLPFCLDATITLVITEWSRKISMMQVPHITISSTLLYQNRNSTWFWPFTCPMRKLIRIIYVLIRPIFAEENTLNFLFVSQIWFGIGTVLVQQFHLFPLKNLKSEVMFQMERMVSITSLQGSRFNRLQTPTPGAALHLAYINLN